MASMDVAKTHEIMARFRPIAPRPVTLPDSSPPDTKRSAVSASAALHLRSRPCRVRKRGGRGGSLPGALPSSMVPARRQRGFFPVLPRNAAIAPAHPVISHCRGFPITPLLAQEKPAEPRLTLSLLPCSPERGVPVERDLLKKLQEPKVITPQPVRPVGSSISVGPINATTLTDPLSPPVSKKPEEVEEEVESEGLPAIVSDSNNRVWLTNSAYKEMVGQPECPWLDSMVRSNSKLGLRTASLSRRISGEVMLNLSDSAIPASSSGFSCRAKIEWARNGNKSVVNAACDVIRLYCETKDYLFTWKFRTTEASLLPTTGEIN